MKIVLLAMFVATPCLAADQFDLVCKGTRLFRDPLAPRAISLPYAVELRIDRRAGRYCYGVCQRTRAIAGSGQKLLVLAKSDAPDGLQSPREDTSVDLVTGRMVSEVTEVAPDQSRSSITATCTSEAFKPFPVSDTAF